MDNVLDLLQGHGITPRKASAAKGGEYHSACPGCGDGGKGSGSDRFHVWPEQNEGRGSYWCRQCERGGDSVQFLMDFESMSYPEACARLGIVLEQRKNPYTRAPVARPRLPRKPADEFQPAAYELPPAAWMEHAAKLVEWAQGKLLADSEAMAWLAARGISDEAARRYRLGYNPGDKGRDLYRDLASWGMEDDGKERKRALWIPRGWVIPLLDDAGRVVQVRIRRRDQDRQEFMADRKYQLLKGSCMATMVLEPEARAFVVVESGLDAVLIAQEMGGLVGAATTWNAQAKPDSRATAILRGSLAILDSLDYDRAGGQAAQWWAGQFRQHRRWPVPVGKDPGEAWAAGVNIIAWVAAGLPAALQAEVFAREGDGRGPLPGQIGQRGGADLPTVQPEARQEAATEAAGANRADQAGDRDDGIMAAVVELIGLLRSLRGCVNVSAYGVDPSYPDERSAANRVDRNRVVELIHKDWVVADFLCLLKPGRYGADYLARFAGLERHHAGGRLGGKP